MNKLIVIYLVVFVLREIGASDDCKFWLENGSPKRPLFLKNTQDVKLVHPQDDGAIHLSKGESLKLTCVDKKFKYFNAKDLVITCVQDDIVEVKKQQMQFVELECEAYPTSIIRKRHESCSQNGRLYEIGYNVRGEFCLIMVACYVPSEARTLYTYYNHSHLGIDNQASCHVPGISFQDDNLYDFNIAETYTQKYQRQEFEILLESNVQAVRFIRGDYKHSLISGSLTGASYFVHGYEKAATFHYLNAAPQWSIIKNGNWRKVENKLRDRLIEGGDKFAIMSGTYGVATLPDSQNVERDLFLYRDEKNQRFHPVPKFFWKLIYDKQQRTGEVIIGINNPYLKEIPDNYFLCKDICSEMNWLGMKRNTISKGYVYCCKMEDFLKATGIENVFADRVTSREMSTSTSSKASDSTSTSSEAPKCDEYHWGFCDGD